jgi:hypothetical protein
MDYHDIAGSGSDLERLNFGEGKVVKRKVIASQIGDLQR